MVIDTAYSSMMTSQRLESTARPETFVSALYASLRWDIGDLSSIIRY